MIAAVIVLGVLAALTLCAVTGVGLTDSRDPDYRVLRAPGATHGRRRPAAMSPPASPTTCQKPPDAG